MPQSGQEERGGGETTLFGVNLLRSQALYHKGVMAAQAYAGQHTSWHQQLQDWQLMNGATHKLA